ncbi:hypothetical protein ACFWIX_14530 [Pseudarthrobacter sp. NPDC058362]|uniref:hypothetical protein n=1 Tax=Pseudarthrobacter sp. NPDC058362 TaxID=3346458 RepID=UPI0036659022
MDHTLNARISIDVPSDVVRIDVEGSLDQQSRPVLIHIIGRVRRMGIRSHIRVDLSGAELIASAALAGLRGDLNAMDALTLPGLYSAGVSIEVTPGLDVPAAGEPLTVDGGGSPTSDVHPPVGLPPTTGAYLDELCGRPLADYADPELLAASDALFSLLDSPGALAGADLLGRYNDIGREILRRQQSALDGWPAETPGSRPAAGNQAAS